MSENDLSLIPTDVVYLALCDTIEKKLKTNKYKMFIRSASIVGDNNFLGSVNRVTFSKDGEDKQDKLILKVAPQIEARRLQLFSRPEFLREIYMFNEVLPYFRQFEESKGIELSGFVEYPKCYRTVDEELSESVFLEDLCARGFSIIDRLAEDLSADHVNLVMQALGKFHAISFALKDQQPEKYEELASNLKNTSLNANEFVKEYFNKQADRIYKVLADEGDAELLAKMKKTFENGVMDVVFNGFDLELTDPGSVISHGDAWQNNIMFRNDENGKPVEACLLDWQVSRYSSPIADIVYFIFCSTTKELRDTHYNDFLNVYYQSLATHIRRLNSDPEKLFPYPKMQEHFDKYANYGLVMAAVSLPLVGTDEVDKSDENSTKLLDISHSKFNKRLRDVVVDMVQLGYV